MLFSTAEVKSHLFTTCPFVTAQSVKDKIVLMAINGEDMPIFQNDTVSSGSLLQYDFYLLSRI